MHDLIVLSDLHMGRGINPETRRFYTLENFFFDDDFAKLCDYLCKDSANRNVPFRLLFNGDTFDLLRIDTLPQQTGASMQEQRFGPPHTPQQAAITIKEIMQGHPSFVRGLGQVLNAGHEVLFLPGNHDIEMQWAPVQDQVRRALMGAIQLAYGEQAAQDAQPLLRFLPWFYHEPKRIWIEHGCQYDPENSFKYLLRGSLAGPGGDAAGDAVAHFDTEQDMPLGNFFQRYLYNAFGHITFIVPSTRANFRYVKWLLFNAPSLLFRVIFSHGPFVFQVLRRLSRQSDKVAQRALEEAHARALARLSEDSGLNDRLHAIDGLKEVHADAVQAAKSLGWQALKMVSSTLLFAILVAGLWFFGLYFITELAVSIGPKALLFLFMTLALATATLGAILWLFVGSPVDVSPRPLRRAAARIAALLDVSVVSFGHSHDEEIWRLDGPSGGRAWYCNTGTWIAVFTHDVLMPRERVQYTFLRVQGHEAALMHWSPGRGEPLAVVLLDEGAPPMDL